MEIFVHEIVFLGNVWKLNTKGCADDSKEYATEMQVGILAIASQYLNSEGNSTELYFTEYRTSMTFCAEGKRLREYKNLRKLPYLIESQFSFL